MIKICTGCPRVEGELIYFSSLSYKILDVSKFVQSFMTVIIYHIKVYLSKNLEHLKNIVCNTLSLELIS